MDFTNFCCRSGGSNLNAGTRTGDTTEPGTSADLTYASGNWVQSTGVFTVASGNPSSDGVAVGDFVSVYADGSTVTGFVGRVTARDATTITVSSTAISGTKPTDGTGNRTLKVGGAWKGPNAAEGFPFSFIKKAATNAAGDIVRVLFKNDAQFDVTAAITHTFASAFQDRAVVFEGYASTYGDNGIAIIDGGSSGASYVVLTISDRYVTLRNLHFNQNGATGSASGFSLTGTNSRIVNCKFSNMRGAGLAVGITSLIERIECYSNNVSNTALLGGVVFSSNGEIRQSILRDNTRHGIVFTAGFDSVLYVDGCIIDSNSTSGYIASNSSQAHFRQCDFYNNGSHGADINTSIGSGTPASEFENCNFVKNGGYGIISKNSYLSFARNCGFGSGTQANTSGKISGTTIEEVGTVDYASDVTPWVDPANGDFRINLAAAKGAGYGAFPGSGGTVGYPDIGAAQHQETGGGGGLLRHPGMLGGLVG